MLTVAANELIGSTIKRLERDPRMPAILDGGDDVWMTWLGKNGATPDAAKVLLRKKEGVNWTSAPEPKKPRSKPKGQI